MQPLRLGVVTAGFKLPLKQAVQTARDIGADGVQFDFAAELKPADLSETGRRHFLHLLDEMGLKVASVPLATRRPLYDLEHLEARINATKEAMQFAYQLRSQVVTLRLGGIPGDENSAEFDVLRQALEDLARHGNRVGATVALIPSGESPEALRQLLSQVTDGMIGIDFDPASCVLAGTPPAESLRTLHNFVLHVQARDAFKEAFGAGQEVPLGRGEVDWSEFMAVLDEVGYRGWITANRTQGEDRVRDLTHALKYLKQLVLQ